MKPSERINELWSELPITPFTTPNSNMIQAILNYLDEQSEQKKDKSEAV